MRKIIIRLVYTLILSSSISCSENNGSIDKSNLLGSDYRLFQDTKAWELTKKIREDDIENIVSIIKKDTSLLNFQEETRGTTLLMISILHRQTEIVKLLLEAGANPNLYDKNGTSAIIMACRDKELNATIIQDLLNNGANVNDMEIGKRREGNTTRDFPLITASRSGNLPLVIFLVSQGALVNKTNEYGQTAIGEATIQEHYDVVLFLLKSGARADTEIFKRSGENNKSYKLKDVLLEDNSNSDLKLQILQLLNQPR
ncbi:ankyrin repeat domain-containing protein [Flectobacillus roseus]